MENKNSNSNDYKHQCNKLENFEDEKFYDKYETQNEENDNHFEEKVSELRCKYCKIVRISKEKFLIHLNSRRHLKIIEMNRKRI